MQTLDLASEARAASFAGDGFNVEAIRLHALWIRSLKLIWAAELDSRTGHLKLVWAAELDNRTGQLNLVWAAEGPVQLAVLIK